MSSSDKKNLPVERIIMSALHGSIIEARNAEELALKTIEIKALAKHETMGAFCEPITCCNNVIPEGFVDACKQVGADWGKVKTMLTFKWGNMTVFPHIEVLPEQVAEGAALAKALGQPVEKFIYGCITFGMFNLEGRRVAARNIQSVSPLGVVAKIMKCPTAQILELNQQFAEDWRQSGGTFFEAAEYWRYGKITHDKFGYYGRLVKAYNSLRIQGHHER